jgi:hypothetical protein
MVTDVQVRRLRRKLMDGKTLEAAAAAAAMSERSARTWKEGLLPSETKTARDWRTRPDPFTDVWTTDVVPLLEADETGRLEAKTIVELLEQRYPGRYGASKLRTMQRRVRQWRALQGPPKTVYFEQKAQPGREGAFDFTHGTELRVTILGLPFKHLIFQLLLVFSGWRWVGLAFGETFEALVAGLQGALWDLGGVPAVLRHDNLSAATHELARSGGRALNSRFADVLDHYGVGSSRISPGESHENGAVEKANDLLKSAIEQSLIVRGSSDFGSPDDYLRFVREIVDRRFNGKAAAALAEERQHLGPLPSSRIPSFTTYSTHVRRWSTIRVRGRTYSVPSRLIGHEVEVRQHPDEVEVIYAGRVIERMPRVREEGGHRIDYRHIIWSLVRKPGAFARYRYREDLFPSMAFRRAYDSLRATRGDRADVEYVRILHLAASTMEVTVERRLLELLELAQPFEYADVKATTSFEQPAIPEIAIGVPDLCTYDDLLSGSLGLARGAS